MGIGTYAFGTGPQGLDPVASPSTRTVPTQPVAVQYDPRTRTFVQNADGQMAGVDPVDQAVVMAVSILKSTLASVPDFGLLSSGLARAPRAKVKTIATDRVKVAIKRWIDSGDVTLIDVDPFVATDPGQRGRVVLTVSYRNNRTGSVQTVA